MMPGGSRACGREPLHADPAAQCSRVHEIREHLLAVDLYHRDPLPIASLQVGIAADVDELDVVAADLPHHLERALAEVAAGSVVESDLRATDTAHA